MQRTLGAVVAEARRENLSRLVLGLGRCSRPAAEVLRREFRHVSSQESIARVAVATSTSEAGQAQEAAEKELALHRRLWWTKEKLVLLGNGCSFSGRWGGRLLTYTKGRRTPVNGGQPWFGSGRSAQSSSTLTIGVPRWSVIRLLVPSLDKRHQELATIASMAC